MNQAIRLAVRQPAQQCGVDHGEYRRVRADAQRECDDGNQCEAGILQQPSRAITQVLPECAHKTLLNQECSARELIGWRKSLLEHKKHKEEHKEHKYSFGSDLSLSICFAPFVFFFVLFVFLSAQSIVVPNTSGIEINPEQSCKSCLFSEKSLMSRATLRNNENQPRRTRRFFFSFFVFFVSSWLIFRGERYARIAFDH